MVKARKNLVGQTFGLLTVIQQDEDYIDKSGRHFSKWLCKCECGKEDLVSVRGDMLTQGHVKSCGCLKIKTTRDMGKNNKNLEGNKRDLSGQYGILWLTNTNNECYFDLDDATEILKYTWWEDAHGYPSANINGKYVTMHIFLGYKWHDHKDRNKLNNCKSNLRPCTRQQNAFNISIRKDNTSGIIGVSWDKESNKWLVQINVNKKRKKIGRFINKKDAIRARLEAEKKYFGEFAPQQHLFEEYDIV